MKKITKAVFPVAGFGSRFLPATKVVPKEMLPIIDKPLIQYGVEEAIEAGIKDIIFITSRQKRTVEDHFDRTLELENHLKEKNNISQLSDLKAVAPEDVNFIFIRQSEALGLGHAISLSESVIGNYPFAVILVDDLIDSSPGALSQMVENYAEAGTSIVAVERIKREYSQFYGVVEVDNNENINTIVEKPKPEDAPSDLGVVGRYIFNPKIFSELNHISYGSGGEIQLTDAIEKLLQKETVKAFKFKGTRFDCGSNLGFLKANISYALKRGDIKDRLSAYIKSLKI